MAVYPMNAHSYFHSVMFKIVHYTHKNINKMQGYRVGTVTEYDGNITTHLIATIFRLSL